MREIGKVPLGSRISLKGVTGKEYLFVGQHKDGKRFYALSLDERVPRHGPHASLYPNDAFEMVLHTNCSCDKCREERKKEQDDDSPLWGGRW